jgi:hypothetical protein
MQWLAKLVGLVMPGVGNAVDSVITDISQRAQLKAALQQALLAADVSELADQAGIIKAEAQSESWLTRSWRPMIMLMFGFIVAFNYIIEPVLVMFHVPATALPMPQDLWDLLKLGIGGYVVGRSVEKAAANWQGAN